MEDIKKNENSSETSMPSRKWCFSGLAEGHTNLCHHELQSRDGMRVLVAQQVHDLLARLKGHYLWRLLKGLWHRRSRACSCLWLAGSLACTPSFLIYSFILSTVLHGLSLDCLIRHKSLKGSVTA